MKFYTLLFFVCTSAFFSQAALAVDGNALAKKNNCLLCHSVDNKVMGPAYKEVAQKYRGDPAAKKKLVSKVKSGGAGVWGNVPMPPNSPQVSDADIEAIIDWILML